jgi:hypothetical protein
MAIVNEQCNVIFKTSVHLTLTLIMDRGVCNIQQVSVLPLFPSSVSDCHNETLFNAAWIKSMHINLLNLHPTDQ